MANGVQVSRFAIAIVAQVRCDDGSSALLQLARQFWLLRLRALLARARGDDVAYRDLVNRYRDMAKTLGFEGHIAWAEAICPAPVD